jgi:hypothetical protein
MSTIRVQVTAEDIAEADGKSLTDWWHWPVAVALEALFQVDVDIDGNADDGCIATIGGREDVTLVVGLGEEASSWLDARWVSGDDRKAGEPFSFEIALPEWLCALIDMALEPRCRVCGCTDEQACAGGCFWVEDPEGLGDLCSRCGPPTGHESQCQSCGYPHTDAPCGDCCSACTQVPG